MQMSWSVGVFECRNYRRTFQREASNIPTPQHKLILYRQESILFSILYHLGKEALRIFHLDICYSTILHHRHKTRLNKSTIWLDIKLAVALQYLLVQLGIYV